MWESRTPYEAALYAASKEMSWTLEGSILIRRQTAASFACVVQAREGLVGLLAQPPLRVRKWRFDLSWINMVRVLYAMRISGQLRIAYFFPWVIFRHDLATVFRSWPNSIKSRSRVSGDDSTFLDSAIRSRRLAEGDIC